MPVQQQVREAVRRARSETYRELILAAAERVFADCGYRDAKVQDIAVAAGVATGTVYGCFASKQELYRAVHRINLEALSRRYEELGTVDLSSCEILLARMRIGIAFLTSRPDYLRIYLREAGTWGLDPSDLPAAATAFMDLDLYRAGVEDGDLVEEDPEVLQGLSIAITQVMLFQWLRRGMREDAASLARRAEEHFTRAFFARPGEPR